MSGSEHSRSGHHVVSIPVYVAIFVSLLVLTALTVWAAFVDLGSWGYMHTPIALGIASLKAVLVLWWFMHVKYSVRLTWVFIAAGLLWLVILIAITVGDYVGRDWEARSEGWRSAAVLAPATRHLG